MYVLGYERVDQELQVLDVILRKEEEKYKLILPKMPEGSIKSSELSFIDIDKFRENPEDKEKVKIDMYKINSEGRKYLLAKLSGMRRNVVFRLVKAQEGDLIVRFHVHSITMGYERSGEVPNVFINEDGKMELEQERMVRNYYKNVTAEQVTPVGNNEFDEWDTLKEQIEDGLNKDIIKEAGDCEIGLAVVMESKNL